MASRLKIHLEAFYWLITKCRSADWTALTTRQITEYIPPGQQLPTLLTQRVRLSIPEGLFRCLIPGHNLPFTIHCVSGFAGTENLLSAYQSITTVVLTQQLL